MDTIKFEIPADVVERAAGRVAEHCKKETGRSYPKWAVTKAIKNVFEERVDVLTEDIGDLLVSPSSDEAFLFRRYLDEALESVQVFDAAEVDPEEVTEVIPRSIFTGFSSYSASRLAAMASYIAAKGNEIYKTKLNKLLFYSDFVHYYLHGQSISGSRYVHLPFGPVPEEYESVLRSAAESKQISFVPVGTEAVMIEPGDEHGTDQLLSAEEMATLDWVLASYGKLSSGAISELSHREKAYKFTKQGEHIAYAYAKFFDRLPR